MEINSFISAKQSALKKYFSRMNDMQQEAVFTVEGALLVLAGAGTGKTTVIVNRIANIINFGNAYYDTSSKGSAQDIEFLKDYAEGKTDDFDTLRDIVAFRPVSPYNILAITFTNKAAGELKDRLYSMLGEDGLNVNASTFHSACVRILRKEISNLGFGNDFTIYDSDDSQRMIKSVMDEVDVSEKQFAPKAVLSEISVAKDKMITPAKLLADAGSDYRKKTIARIYKTYQENMKNANALDFDDILVYTVELFEKFPEILEKYQNKYKYILVDEYQDTNNVQFKFVSLLSAKHKNICVVGDDDQSIYGFRGANIENILGFESQFENAKVIRLEQNYRSTQTVLDAANAIISNNKGRHTKNLWTDSVKGNKVIWYKAFDENDEVKFITDTINQNYKKTGKYSDNAILYRMNAQSNYIEKALARNSIPYKIYGGLRFFDRKEIKDVTSYLAVVNNPNDMLRFKRIINEPKRGIGDSTIAIIDDICRDLKISPVEVMKNCEEYELLSKKVNVLKNAASLFEQLIEKSHELPLNEFFDFMLAKTGYMDYLKTLENADNKIQNVNELRSSIIQYIQESANPSLDEFLEETVLYTDADRDSSTEDRVTLMTVHSAKGLEFKNIFIIGLEEGIFPSSRSLDNENDMEEERRLAYVAVTRAKENLYLTSARQRILFGQTQRNVTSRFMREIGSELIDKNDNASVIKKMLQNEEDKAVTETHSMTLQQQLARNKMYSSVPSSSDNYSAGERIAHPIFGEGTIISATPTLNNTMLEIAFDKVGTKKIMAGGVKIRKL